MHIPGEHEPVPMETRMTTQLIAECPQCHMVCAYWDDEDLDEEGHLLCYGRTD